MANSVPDVAAYGPAQRWCVEFGSASKKRNHVPDLLRGEFYLVGPGPTTFDRARMPWSAPEERHPSWELWLHSLKWLDKAVAAGLDPTDPLRDEATALVQEILESWVRWNAGGEVSDAWHGHPTGLRLSTLVGASELLPDHAGVREAVEAHVTWLMAEEHFDGTWNHGLVQSIALLGGALRLGRADGVEVARARIMLCADEMVDDQGVINEQAPGYAGFVHGLLKICGRLLDQNRLAGADSVRAKLRLLPEFIAHATQPDGMLVQIGDTHREAAGPIPGTAVDFVLSAGATGTAPERRVVVYERGYAFARSGWGESRPFADERYFSLRFGPGRIIHGHNDHMSVTYFAEGQEVVVDSGHFGYAPGEYRKHLQSVGAHNMLTVDRVKHNWKAATPLVRHEAGTSSSFFEVADDAFAGVARSRTVRFFDDGPLVVFDRATAQVERTFQQRWQLAPELQLESVSPTSVVLRDPGTGVRAALLHYSMGAETALTAFTRGSAKPLAGWVSRGREEKIPAPSVNLVSSGTRASIVTVVWVDRSEEPLAISGRRLENGWHRLTVAAGDQETSLRVSPGGYIGD